MFDVPEAILKQADKCSRDYSCLKSGQCGDGPMCDVETAYGDGVLCVRCDGWPGCSYHLEFGGARYCVCPVRYAIYQQQSR